MSSILGTWRKQNDTTMDIIQHTDQEKVELLGAKIAPYTEQERDLNEKIGVKS